VIATAIEEHACGASASTERHGYDLTSVNHRLIDARQHLAICASRNKPQGRREGNLETFAAAGGTAGCRGACFSRSSDSFIHIECCVRETATEQ
jgi:hypothetical protein